MINSLANSGSVLESPPPLRRAARHPRFLCVDDNELVRDGIRAVLVGKGWGCHTAGGGEDALQWLAACLEPFDMIITDHQMPGMNGLEFVRKVRATKFAGKILVHSTMLLGIEQAAYEALNVDAIVPKTGNPRPLIKAIEELQLDKQAVWQAV
jgi:CheY-like chemotaxis protein